MRDILVSGIVFSLLPFIFSRPYLGILLWSWIGYMNPHRLSWGFAYDFPFAMIIAIVTLSALFVSFKKVTYFWSPVIGWLLFFNFWMFITTCFSLEPDEAWTQWDKVIKIQIMTFVTFLLMGDKKVLNLFIWVIVISIGFFGFKGGFFTITSGGGFHVLGPPGSFIEGNTEIGLALVMILPLVWYLYLNTTKSWARILLFISLLSIPVAILGTQSRGALLAIAAISFFLWLKSRKKAALFVVMLMMMPALYMFMPESWHDRMSTIGDYKEDSSANERLHAWEFGYEMAVARPIVGGGFNSFSAENYARFVPHQVESGATTTFFDFHSIYFEVLAEHGFVGLAIFLYLGVLLWKTANKIMQLSKGSESDKWAYDLASMIQVSFVGYAVGGAFLGLAYFDLIYHLLIILVLVLRLLEQQQLVTDKHSSV